jgi:tRNA threonylcarbamoyladenosine biosynthesis protein TsaE
MSTHSEIVPGIFTSASPEDTFEFGYELGAKLSGGEVLMLTGPLGAGKTIFAKGIAAGLGIHPDDVSSPTFTLVNRYEARLPFYHLDLYRLAEGPAAGYAAGLDELLDEQNVVILIEWAERLREFSLSGEIWRITIEGDGDAPRQIRIERV